MLRASRKLTRKQTDRASVRITPTVEQTVLHDHRVADTATSLTQALEPCCRESSLRLVDRSEENFKTESRESALVIFRFNDVIFGAGTAEMRAIQ